MSSRRLPQPPLLGAAQQRFVGNRAPEEERQPRCQLEIGHRIRVARAQRGRLGLGPEDERRAGEDAPQRQLDAGLEALVLSRLPVERQDVGGLGWRQRPPECPPAQRRDDAPRARVFLGRGLGAAHEQPRADRRLDPLRVVRPLDRDRLHVRRALGVERVGEVADEALQPVGLEHRRGLLQERRRDVALPGFDEAPDLEARGLDRVRGVGGVLLQRVQILVAAEHSAMHMLAVDQQLQLLGILQAADRAEVGAVQADLEVVFPVHGKGMPRHQPAHRAERQPFEMDVLRQVLAHGIGVAADADAEITDRDRADLTRGRQIRLQQCRRAALRIGDVVEAERRVVGRQQRRHVHIEPQQIADRIAVLGAIQAAKHRAAREWLHRRPVEFALQPRDQPIVGGRVGALHAVRRHGADAKLAYDALPHVGVVRHARQVERLERQSGGLQARVVTRDAVLGQRRLVCGARAWRGGWHCGPCGLAARGVLSDPQIIAARTRIPNTRPCISFLTCSVSNAVPCLHTELMVAGPNGGPIP